MPVKIENMEMPESCGECRFMSGFIPSRCSACLGLKELTLDVWVLSKPSWCPLKECK